MITIRTFDNPIEAHLLKGKLESEGITAYLFDENIVSLNPLYNNLIGGIKLNVSALDEKRAMEILQEIDNRSLRDNEGNEVVCPRCNSNKYYFGYKSIGGFGGIIAFLLSLLFFVYPFYYKSVKKCRDCGCEFQ